MSNLTDKNIEFITQIISGSKIASEEMKEDLIDHFCCAIEEEMKKGLSFENSYDKAYQNICPDGFDEIQRETVYLLTFKKIKSMKRLLYVSGYLTAIGITSTVCLKLTHTQGGPIALLVSSLMLMFLFLPSLFLNLYKRELSKNIPYKIMYLFGFIGLLFLAASILFKLMHWGRETAFLFSSIVILNFAFFPFLFFKMYRKSVE